MRRPPDCVLFVARTHWLVGAVIGLSVPLMLGIGQRLPGIELGARSIFIAGAVALLYLLAGTLVWRGAPLGRTLSRICSLIYLPRPQFGSRVWETMNRADFQAHFSRP